MGTPDAEMEAPEKIRPRGLADYFEVLTRAVFQAGFLWSVVDAKWDGFRRYLRSHPDFEATAAALKGHFRYLGDLGVFFFLWVVSEPVPPYEDWCRSRGIEPQHA